jgi:hypothetical protein
MARQLLSAAAAPRGAARVDVLSREVWRWKEPAGRMRVRRCVREGRAGPFLGRGRERATAPQAKAFEP